MKYFFTAAIAATRGGEAHSAEAVRHRIKQLIDGESARDDVLSDDAIVQKLRGGRHRHRPPHGRQVPRSLAHPLLGRAPAREDGHEEPPRAARG